MAQIKMKTSFYRQMEFIVEFNVKNYSWALSVINFENFLNFHFAKSTHNAYSWEIMESRWKLKADTTFYNMVRFLLISRFGWWQENADTSSKRQVLVWNLKSEKCGQDLNGLNSVSHRQIFLYLLSLEAHWSWLQAGIRTCGVPSLEARLQVIICRKIGFAIGIWRVLGAAIWACVSGITSCSARW